MEKYSVLMSLYHKEKASFFSEALESMINQTVKPDEIVIVEDGPLTDDLYDIKQYFLARYPDLFTIVRNETNLGLGKSLNNGLIACRNELVARMDTDDISVLDRCEKQLKLFQSKPYLSLVGAWVDEFVDSPDIIVSTRRVPCSQKEIYDFAKRRSAFNHPVIMYKKTDVLGIGGYSSLRRNQDVDLFGRMLYQGYQAENIGESLLYFRSNDSLAKRRKSFENTKSYIDTIYRFWKMGYSSFLDYIVVCIGQLAMFLLPISIQKAVYKYFLRR